MSYIISYIIWYIISYYISFFFDIYCPDNYFYGQPGNPQTGPGNVPPPGGMTDVSLEEVGAGGAGPTVAPTGAPPFRRNQQGNRQGNINQAGKTYLCSKL